MNLIILGPQGSGKGTQAALLAKRYALTHLDVGLLLRAGAARKTPLGRKLDRMINKNKELVPDAVIHAVLTDALRRLSRHRGVIIDGAPRRRSQIAHVEKALAAFGRCIDHVVYITVPQRESIARISKRFHCASCQRKFILGTDLDKNENHCRFCGGQIVQRKDDTTSGVRKRLAIFKKETMPVIAYYRKRNKVIAVDGRMDIRRTYADIVKRLAQE